VAQTARIARAAKASAAGARQLRLALAENSRGWSFRPEGGRAAPNAD
jgi:hypothetical protein